MVKLITCVCRRREGGRLSAEVCAAAFNGAFGVVLAGGGDGVNHRCPAFGHKFNQQVGGSAIGGCDVGVGLGDVSRAGSAERVGAVGDGAVVVAQHVTAVNLRTVAVVVNHLDESAERHACDRIHHNAVHTLMHFFDEVDKRLLLVVPVVLYTPSAGNFGTFGARHLDGEGADMVVPVGIVLPTAGYGIPIAAEALFGIACVPAASDTFGAVQVVRESVAVIACRSSILAQGSHKAVTHGSPPCSVGKRPLR